MQLYLASLAGQLPVIAGHAGAITPALRALGVHAADAGIASSEAFDMNSAKATRPPSEDEAMKKRSGGPSSRMYLRELGQSFDKKTIELLMTLPAVRDRLSTCRLPCHRFLGGDVFARGKEHSLRARIDEAADVSKAMTKSMRFAAVAELLESRRSTVTAINAALVEAGIRPLDTRPTDNHRNWFMRELDQRSAA